MRLNKLILLIGLFFWAIYASAQHDDLINRVLEKYTETTDQEFDYQDLYDQLALLADNKMNINTATKSDLLRLFFLSPVQVNAILDHIRRFGPVISPHELQVINELDDETIRNLLAFITLNNQLSLPYTLSDMFSKGSNLLVQQTERDFPISKGYTTPDTGESAASNNYIGSPYRWMMRYRYQFRNNLVMGFTGEKDAGEPFLRAYNRKGYDFNSAHLVYRSNGFIRVVALGDYQLAFGQMLTIGTGLAFGKSAQVLNTKRLFNGIRPYRSVNESAFLRGTAVTLGFGKVTVTPYYSSVWNDATPATQDTSLADELEAVSGFYLTGYHRTFNEKAKKHQIRTTTYGVNTQYQLRNFTAGVTYNHIGLNKNLNTEDRFYNRWYERGTAFDKLGIYYDFVWQNFNFYGESSYDFNGSAGNMHGLLMSLGKILDINMFYRRYDRNFTTLQTNGIGENSVNRNEEGVYIGGILKWNKKLSMAGYYDVFRFPWARYLANAPGAGKEHLLELNYRPNKKSLMYVRYRGETKQLNAGGYTESRQTAYTRHYLRFHTEYELLAGLTGKTRIELSNYSEKGTTYQGSVVYQDFNLKGIIPRVTLTTRLALFTIDDFNARIYAYENDIPYSYSIPAFQHSGIRSFIMARINIHGGLDLWVRAANTYYSNQKVYGSGNDAVNVSYKTNISGLLKWSF